MKKPDIEKLSKIVKKCSVAHHSVESDVDIVRATQKAYQTAYDIMVWANKNKDKALFENVYKLVKGLIPESTMLDSVVLFKLKEYKSEFLEKIVKLLIDRPETILNPTRQQLKTKLNTTKDENEQKTLNTRLDNINEGIGQIQLNRGILCKESTDLIRKNHIAQMKKDKKYFEEFGQYKK